MHPIYNGLPNGKIACIDMKSFYASCSAAAEGLDVMKECIAVVGNLKQKGSVVLASSPPMKKKYGVKTGTRLYEIPSSSDIILLEPNMELYIEISMAITRLLNKYVPSESIHVYSIDEQFIDLENTELLWGPVRETIRRIQKDILDQFQLHSAVGFGPNMLLAKLSLDLEAKHTGYAEWTYEDVPEKLWPVRPLSKMWGIGSRTERTLNDIGIYSVGDLANADLSRMEKKFGIMGNQLYYHSWGIDKSELGTHQLEGQVSYGKGQTLLRDYNTRDAVLVVLLETCEDICRRARESRKVGRTIQLSIGYSRNSFGGGFSRSKTFEEGSNDTMTIYKEAIRLFDRFYDDRPVRYISLSVTNLEDEGSMQLNLFETDKWRQRKLAATMDAIRNRFGDTAVLRAVSLTKDGTAIKRASLVGGHKK